MILMPIVYVTDIERSLPFYQALGARLTEKGWSKWWAALAWGDAILALHYVEEPIAGPGRVALALVSEEKLEQVVERLAESRIPLHRQISDETFGRSLQIKDPDGLVIQINEHAE
jgi:catechol 2,3-dioxygenase-like lactoylglutathione lyase family enzyme